MKLKVKRLLPKFSLAENNHYLNKAGETETEEVSS